MATSNLQNSFALKEMFIFDDELGKIEGAVPKFETSLVLSGYDIFVVRIKLIGVAEILEVNSLFEMNSFELFFCLHINSIFLLKFQALVVWIVGGQLSLMGLGWSFCIKFGVDGKVVISSYVYIKIQYGNIFRTIESFEIIIMGIFLY